MPLEIRMGRGKSGVSRTRRHSVASEIDSICAACRGRQLLNPVSVDVMVNFLMCS